MILHPTSPTPTQLTDRPTQPCPASLFASTSRERRGAPRAASARPPQIGGTRVEGPGAAAACRPARLRAARRPAGSGGAQACARLRWRGGGRRGRWRRGSVGARAHAVARGAVTGHRVGLLVGRRRRDVLGRRGTCGVGDFQE